MGIIIMLILLTIASVFWFNRWSSWQEYFEIVLTIFIVGVVALLFSILIIMSGSEDSSKKYTNLREIVERDNQVLRIYDLAVVNAVKGSETHIRFAAEKVAILKERDKCSREMQEIMVAKIEHKASFMFGIFIDMPESER